MLAVCASLLLMASAEGSPHFPGATMCCNWRTKPHVSTALFIVWGRSVGWGLLLAGWAGAGPWG